MVATDPTRLKGSKLLRILSIIAVVFGVVSIFSGGMALFGPQKALTLAGDVVPFVVWFNFLAGGVYIVAGIGLYRRSEWAAHLALALTVTTVIIFIAMTFYITTGAAFETRTIGAMIFRTAFWIFITIFARKALADAASNITP